MYEMFFATEDPHVSKQDQVAWQKKRYSWDSGVDPYRVESDLDPSFKQKNLIYIQQWKGNPDPDVIKIQL